MGLSLLPMLNPEHLLQLSLDLPKLPDDRHGAHVVHRRRNRIHEGTLGQFQGGQGTGNRVDDSEFDWHGALLELPLLLPQRPEPGDIVEHLRLAGRQPF